MTEWLKSPDIFERQIGRPFPAEVRETFQQREKSLLKFQFGPAVVLVRILGTGRSNAVTSSRADLLARARLQSASVSFSGWNARIH